MNHRFIIVFALAWIPRTLAWIHPHRKSSRVGSTLLATIDFQSDTKRFGRGEMHLSALLEEKDVVVFQSGSWLVDGVLVGDGPVQFEYCMVESLQVVWTHNCEHGVIRGYSVLPAEQEDVRLQVTWDPIEFGPEQLIARLPVEWVDERTCKLLVPLNEELWKETEE